MVEWGVVQNLSRSVTEALARPWASCSWCRTKLTTVRSQKSIHCILLVLVSIVSITDLMHIQYGHHWQCNRRAPLIWKRFQLLLKVERDGPGYGWKIGHSRLEIFSLIKQKFVVLQRFFGLNCDASFICVLVSRWWFQICVIFTGRIPILTNIFQMGWNHQLGMVDFWLIHF